MYADWKEKQKKEKSEQQFGDARECQYLFYIKGTDCMLKTKLLKGVGLRRKLLIAPLLKIQRSLFCLSNGMIHVHPRESHTS